MHHRIRVPHFPHTHPDSWDAPKGERGRALRDVQLAVLLNSFVFKKKIKKRNNAEMYQLRFKLSELTWRPAKNIYRVCQAE